MLLEIFASVSGAGTAINIAQKRNSLGKLRLTGFALMRFAEYYLASTLLYLASAYAATELTIKVEDEQQEPGRFSQWNFRELAKMVCAYTGVRFEVTGREKLPADSRYLVVSNHRSLFDPVTTAAAFGKENYLFISKPENFKIPVAGKLMYRCGCMPMNRENNREALKTIKRAAEIIKSDKASVVIYPEGTRSKQDKLLPFHAGSFKIAQRAGVPVVILAVRGTELVKHNMPFRKTKIYLDIVDVIDAEYVKTHSTKDTAALAQSIMQSKLTLEQLKKEKSSENV